VKVKVNGILNNDKTIARKLCSREGSQPTAIEPTQLAVGSHQIEIRLLIPHPSNASIYGEDEDVSSLVESIQRTGWIKPLVVTPNYIIISGHRRRQAALVLGLETVPVEVREFSSSATELEALLLENQLRHKTIEQKVREANVWKDVESELAHRRKLARLKQGEHRPDVQNFAHRETLGKTRDRLAKKVGLGSGFTYSKAAQVVAQIDKELSLGNQAVAKGLRKVLNSQSVDAAYKLTKQPPVERAGVLELIVKGKAKTTLQAEALLGRTYSSRLKEFSVGDVVYVNSPENPHHGERGQVDLLLEAEQQVSVILENIAHSVRFDPQELTLSAKAPPPSPYQAGDLVRIDIDRAVSIEAAVQKFKGLWGRVEEIGELGSVKVDVGCRTLQLFAFDLKPIDNPSSQLKDVAVRVLRLRKLELDEIEQKMLDVLQAREWFTAHQLIHLETIENLYLALHPMG
jgi:ParB/RepB/Spo0J family partition protein